MSRLAPGQQLNAGQELRSDNGWLRLIMQGDGNLVLYRTQTMQPLWASGTDGRPVAVAVMQGDGNLVAYGADGTPYWDSGTWGHPGAAAVLQDDGNLVIYDAAGGYLWDSGTVVGWDTPTIGVVDTRGYSYVETSERWQVMCRELPCFDALRWPGYDAVHLDIEIDGEPIVVQLWKGWCQKFLGLDFFPGGIGAEVGIYRRMPGRVRPTSLPFLPPPVEAFLLQQLSQVTDDELWWPAPDLQAEITSTFINPVTNRPVFTAGPQHTYWLCKWMNEASYVRYVIEQGGRVPPFPNDYVLEYTINGETRRWPSLGTTARVPSRTPVTAAVRRPDHLDIVVTDPGGARTAAWRPGAGDGWQGWWPIGSLPVHPAAPAHVVSRSTDRLDVFATGLDGGIRTAAWEPNRGGWRGWWSLLGGLAAPGAPVTAVCRHPDALDVFVVGTDRHVWTAAWDAAAGGEWRGWWRVGDATVPHGSPVGVVSRSTDKLDIFVTDVNGRILTAAWEPGFTDGWHGWWSLAGGLAAPGAPVTAVSRRPDLLDAFVVGTDNHVWTAAWEPRFTDGWHGWWRIGDAVVPHGSTVSAVSRSRDHLDVVVTDVHGAIRTAAWEPAFTDGWHGWWSVRTGQAAPGATATVVSRSTDKLDVFVTGTDGRVWTAAWEPAFADGWRGWWPIGH